MEPLLLNENQVTDTEFSNSVKKAYDEYKNTFVLSRQLSETRDVKEILDRLLFILGEIVQFSSLALLLKEKYSDDFFLHQGYNLNDDLTKRINWLERSGYLDWSCLTGAVAIIPDEDKEDNGYSMVLVPLLSGKQKVGVLVIFLHLHSSNLTPRQSDLLFLLGTQAAQALENAYLYIDMALKNQAISSVKNFLENSLESMADGLFAIDMENKISLFNSAAATLFGFTHTEAIGSKIHCLFLAEFCNFFDHLLEMTNTTGKFEGEFRYQHPITQKEFPLSILLSILKNTQNEQIGVIALCRDMSEHQELIHLRRLDQLKDEFISSVSHELRTPLTAIKSFTEILLNYEEESRDTQKEFLGIIEKETNRLIELINDLLDLSRMNRGDFELNLSAVDIRQVFAESINSLKILADAKNISIVLQLDENQNLVWGDFNRLVQVFVNLIGNGIKFSPKDSKIEISSNVIKGKRLDDHSDYLLVSVKDNGIGIPAEFHKAIFERFKQVSHDVATKPEGSGLGLSICKKIIEKLDGNIWVESEEHKGSTFFFTLPLAGSTKHQKDD